jgi:hypothetical protein
VNPVAFVSVEMMASAAYLLLLVVFSMFLESWYNDMYLAGVGLPCREAFAWNAHVRC